MSQFWILQAFSDSTPVSTATQETYQQGFDHITTLVETSCETQESGENISAFAEETVTSCTEMSSDHKREQKKWFAFDRDPLSVPEPNSGQPSPMQLARSDFDKINDSFIAVKDSFEEQKWKYREGNISLVDLMDFETKLDESRKKKNLAAQYFKDIQDSGSTIAKDLKAKLQVRSTQGLLWYAKKARTIDQLCSRARACFRFGSATTANPDDIGAQPAAQGSSSNDKGTSPVASGATR